MISSDHLGESLAVSNCEVATKPAFPKSCQKEVAVTMVEICPISDHFPAAQPFLSQRNHDPMLEKTLVKRQFRKSLLRPPARCLPKRPRCFDKQSGAVTGGADFLVVEVGWRKSMRILLSLLLGDDDNSFLSGTQVA